MKQRIFLVAGLLLMLLLAAGTSLFFASRLTWLNTLTQTPGASPTPAPTPTDTPTPIPPPEPTDTPELTPTPQPLVNGASAYLVDVTTGHTLLSVNQHEQLSMWSTTKIMTALLAIENLPMDTIVPVEQSELDEVPAGMSIAYLKAGDKISIEHLLDALLLPSGSDAAVVLAHAVSGDVASFVTLMNARAAQLGLRNTYYTTPYGAADANHYSSAADLVKLARVAMQQPVFAQIVATPALHLAANAIRTTYDWQNILTPFFNAYHGALGIKTGSNATGTDWCMVFAARRQGHLLIGAEMQAPSESQIFTDAENILDRGFAML